MGSAGGGERQASPTVNLKEMPGVVKPLHSELWHACAGPLVNLPPAGSLAYYFPQGHIDQVAVSTKRLVTSQMPNYPNLPSQIMCQVRSVVLHADKETDEIYAQMSLQPIKTEKDVYQIPDSGLKASKHPSEFFCKTLTASDTSTHGGFSVPRRAAEKLFPPLDYTMQPPFQELVVKDLHDNTWTFRHIYRGQPKRHLLTTGWSIFVGTKRLRAGDAVLFIRDEKGQLMIGVRRANRQQTSLPSSVLSADSMHIGVLAAAAHAAANRTPFTVFYNPRACPTEFVIPGTKFRKAIYGTQVSVGMRFGMMFETEESNKRRYMGTIVGVSDLDPIRWPGSKWRNLQVDWDEPGCGDKQNRVSAWEIETPESLFLFPSLTSGFKRSFHPGFIGGELEWGSMIKRPFIQLPDTGYGNPAHSSLPNLLSEHMVKVLLRPDNLSYPASLATCAPESIPEGSKAHVNMAMIQKANYIHLQNSSVLNHQQQSLSQPDRESQEQGGSNMNQIQVIAEKIKPETPGEHSQLISADPCNDKKVASGVSNPMNEQGVIAVHDDQKLIAPPGESSALRPQLTNVPPSDISGLDSLFQYMDAPDWQSYPSSVQAFGGGCEPSGSCSMLRKQSEAEVNIPSLILMGEELWDQNHNLNNVKYSTQSDEFGSFSQLSDDTMTQSGIYSCIDVDVAGRENAANDASALNNLCSSKEPGFQYPAEFLVGDFDQTQDLQSHITTASLADSQAFFQDHADNSGGTSSSNVDFDECSLLQNNSWQQVVPPMRTYTKVQKAGSVGRSIDVTSFNGYDELRSAIERMFGLDGLLNDPKGSGWKLVYVDFENDVLLVGDDPWEEFVGCVRCIRILSPAEVVQMSEEGMQLLNGNVIPGTCSPL